MNWDHSKAENCSVTSLMSSRGFLWVGTSIGIVLLYSLPRLKDGVPRIWGKPWVSCHSHNGPIKFLLPIYCDTVNVLPTFAHNTVPMSGLRKEVENDETKNTSDEQVVNDLPDTKQTLPDVNVDLNAVLEETDMNSESQVTFRNPNKHTIDVTSDCSGVFTSENSQLSTAKVLPVHRNDSIASPERSMSLCQRQANQYSPICMLRKSHGNEKLREELTNKLGMQNRGLRRSLPNLLDIDGEEDEITLYYNDLMTYKDGPDAFKVDQAENKSQNLKSVKEMEEKKEVKEVQTDMSPNNGTLAKSKENNQTIVKKKSLTHSFSVQSESKHTTIKPTLSLRSSPKDVQKVKALDTMGKRTCNAVIVVSGGDGYFDWRKIKERNVVRNDEASLMMWMYKY